MAFPRFSSLSSSQIPVIGRGDLIKLSGKLDKKFEILRVDNQGGGIVDLILREVK